MCHKLITIIIITSLILCVELCGSGANLITGLGPPNVDMFMDYRHFYRRKTAHIGFQREKFEEQLSKVYPNRDVTRDLITGWSLVETQVHDQKYTWRNCTIGHVTIGMPFKRCTACADIVKGLHWIWSRNKTANCIAELISYACIRLKIANNILCSSTVHAFKPGSATIRVLQISDIHFDINYKVGAEAKCQMPLCCRKNSSTGTVKHPAGQWGTIGKCDIPIWSVENMFQHIAAHEKGSSLNYLTPLVKVCAHVRGRRHRICRSKLLLWIAGNNNTPSWSGANSSITSPPLPKYNPTSPEQVSVVPSDPIVEHGEDSYYTYSHIMSLSSTLPGRLVIDGEGTLDSSSFDESLVYLNTTDPDGTLQWLTDQLSDAERSGDKVHIIGHIPSGNEECMSTWARNYYDIVNRYENTIRAQFFGHSHKDSFAVFYENGNPKQRPTNVMYISPSVTTFVNKLPAYRIYTIDGDHQNTTWSVLDHETYVLNVTEAKANGKPEWKLEYQASTVYNLSSAFPNDWNNLISEFIKNRTSFNKYIKYVYTDFTTPFHSLVESCAGSGCSVNCAQGLSIHYVTFFRNYKKLYISGRRPPKESTIQLGGLPMPGLGFGQCM